VKAEEKEGAEKKFIEISKAYKVLTDEEARKLFDEFGHPDGKQGESLPLSLSLMLCSF
jgi:translocation protein SEC63